MIRPIPLLAAAVLAWPAMAQQTEVPMEDVAPDAETAQAETAPQPAAPEASGEGDGAYGVFAATAVRDLLGQDVMESSGADIGRVRALVRTPDAVQAVVGVGGFLGFGRHDVALPLSSFVMTEAGLMLPDMTEEALRGLPEYDGTLEALPRDVTVAGDPLPEPVPAPVD